ncbi:MAG: GIY-YIG nuclease family protein [Betaproteobacteria bacterium]
MQENTATEEPTGEPPQAPWFVYFIECMDGSIYTGIALDVAARYAVHASGKGARYTRSHPPARLLGSLECPDHSSALKTEYRIKQLSTLKKRRYIAELLTSQTAPAEAEQDSRA